MADQDGAARDEPSPILVHPSGQPRPDVISPLEIRLVRPSGTPSAPPPQRQPARIGADRPMPTPSFPQTPPSVRRRGRRFEDSTDETSEDPGEGPSTSTGTSPAASAVTHPLLDTANRLGEVVEAVDEVNKHLGAFRGIFTDIRTGVGQFLAEQGRENIRVDRRYDEDLRQAARHKADKLQALNRRKDEKLRAEDLRNIHWVSEHATKDRQAADIRRAVDTFEALFGDLAVAVQWVGRLMRRVIGWICGEGFPKVVAIVLTLLMVCIKCWELQNAASTPALVGTGTSGRVGMILESNPGWRELLKDPRPVLENLGNLGGT